MSIQGKEILVIDDVKDVRMRCRKVLENLGMVVTEADSAEQALTSLAERLPHVIILDLQMPGKSGFDFLLMRSRHLKLKEVPVIVLSSLGERNAVHRAISLGADDFVLKPLNAALISQRVRKHVRGLDYLRRAIPVPHRPTVSINVNAQVTKIEETSLTLESPVRIAAQTRIELQPSPIPAVDTSKYPLLSDSEPGRRGISGRYITTVHIVGLDQTISRKSGKKPGA